MDIDDGQVQKANENIIFAEVGNRIHVVKASSMSKKSGLNSKDVKEFYVLVKLSFLLSVL